jgi:hypothetical protein
MVAMSIANGVKFPFSIASPVEINSELENQIVQLKTCLKIEQQNYKSLQDEIVIKDKKIKIQQDEIKKFQTTVTKLSTKPAQKTITTSISPSNSLTSVISI